MLRKIYNFKIIIYYQWQIGVKQVSLKASQINCLEFFDKGLKNVIDSFERAREWADLSNCLQKVKKQIDQNRDLPIPRQRDLAKRLAQCLNPEINVIHQLTLEVYKEVFEREIQLIEKDRKKQIDVYERKSSIALFFSGLFNFYQFAAFEVKQSFLDLISKYLLEMKKELILSLPGFMLCMLPALEDQNGEILKKVEEILKKTEVIVGTSEFYGEVWKAMLRTPRSRLSAIRQLDKRIPKSLEQAKEFRDRDMIHISDYTIKIINREVSLQKDLRKKEHEENMKQRMDLHDYFFFYYPNKSKLVINALMSGLSIAEPQVYVNRATLDFMISHMAINTEINSITENVRLVECATLAYTKKDFATLNKISNWLFGHLDEDEDECDSRDPTIITIVESQKNLFRQSMDVKLTGQVNQNKFGVDQVKGNQANSIDKLINNPILILLRILSDEQNTTEPILKKLSIHLIKFIRFHLINRNADQKSKFNANLRNLLEQIAPYFKAVLESLATKLQQEIENLDYSQSNEQNLESIDLISFAIFDLPLLYKKLLVNDGSRLYLTQILSNLLKGMNKISNNHQNLELILPSLDVIDQILGVLQKFEENSKGPIMIQKRQTGFAESIESFNNLYCMMSHKLIEDSKTQDYQEDKQHYKQELDTFKKYNNIMLQIMQYQNMDSQTKQMPEWLDMLIQSCKTGDTKICLVSADVFIKLLSIEDLSNQQGGGSITHIQRLIADPQNQSGKFTEKVLKNVQHFKSEFLKFLQESDQKDSIEKNGFTHCKEIIQNLWSLLDNEVDTENIANQLREFDKLVPRIFSDVVIEDLQNKQTRQMQDRAIKKFTIFWKFTGPHYPSYKPFETEISGKKYLALHNMINFLEDTDPTLRLSCRSWLSQSKQFNRILDPLIEEFIKYSNFKYNQGGSVIIEGDFEYQYVIQNFGKLRNIILNTQDDIIEYMVVRQGQSHIQQLYQQKFQQNQNQQQSSQLRMIPNQALAPIMENPQLERQKTVQFDPKQMFPIENYLYLDILVEITLQFIRAEYAEGKQRYGGNELQRENQLSDTSTETLTVNASACEFMELILKQVEKYSSISNKISHIIVKPLIETFYHVIKKKNHAMQVNIINLLDLIFNECNFQGHKQDSLGSKDQTLESQQNCHAIFKNSKLIDAIILGLKSEVSFVRQKFIRFVEMYVPYLRKFTRENETFKDDFRIQIEKLIDCFCELLKRVDVSFFSSSRKVGAFKIEGAAIARDQIGNPVRMSSVKKISSGGARLSFGENTNVTDNFENLVINQESDIVLIIGGLQCIINTCLDIKSDGSQIEEEQTYDDEFNEEEQIRIGKISKNEANKKSGFLGGIFGGGENNYFTPDVFNDVKKCIHDKLQKVIISCIYCWNHMDMFNWNDYHFTRHGMFAYQHEDKIKIQEKIRVKRKNQKQPDQSYDSERRNSRGQENDKFLTFEENFQQQANGIQRKVIQLLRPIAKKIPEQLIDGALDVWLKKSLLGNVDVNRSYEKIIQMLVCIQQASVHQRTQRIEHILPVYQVIQSTIKYIQAVGGNKPKETLVNIQRWTKNNPELSVTQTSSETLLNSFLYAYILYNPCMFDPLYEQKSDDKMKEFQKVYNSMIKYFNVFKLSRNPLTVCWLLEILNIVCLKFNVQEAKLDNRLKKDYHDLFNNMLTNFSSIFTDTFNIKFNEVQKYNLAFPPTVYELLWRYEYIAFKSTINDSPDNKGQEEEFHFQQQQQKKKKRKNEVNVIASNGSVFFKKQELKIMIDQKFEYQHQMNEHSIFKNMEILMKDRSQLSKDYMKQSDFMEKIKIAIRGETTPDDLLEQSKFFSIITLKQILCHLMINLIGTGDTEKTNKSMQIILGTTIQMLQSDNKNAKSPQYNHVMNEVITEFFASVVEKSHAIDPGLIKPYRREIIDLFNFDTFFQVSMLNLKQWQKIMKYFIDSKPDEIFEEQMQKWNFQGGLFANNNTVIAQKCYAMKRIAFLIFSCDDDDFQNQLDQLMKKMIEVFKQKQRSDIKQRLFLFFLTRVLLIRLNFQTLTEALRKLWPHLLNELISVFEVKQGETMDKENTELTIEAIKLVELLSSLNIEDFQMNQWIFLIDGYGMQQENNDNLSDVNQKSISSKPSSKINELKKNQVKNQGSHTERGLQPENTDVFKTFIVRFIDNQEYSFYNVESPEDGMKNQEFDYDLRDQAYALNCESDQLSASPNSLSGGGILGPQPQSQNISRQISSESHDDSQDFTINKLNGEFDSRLQLQEQACNLQQSINDSNVIGNEFNRQEAEAKIEIDFLNNDDILN